MEQTNTPNKIYRPDLKSKQYWVNYYIQHKEELKERNHINYQKNHEHNKQIKRDYYYRNKEYYSNLAKARYLKKKQLQSQQEAISV